VDRLDQVAAHGDGERLQLGRRRDELQARESAAAKQHAAREMARPRARRRPEVTDSFAPERFRHHAVDVLLRAGHVAQPAVHRDAGEAVGVEARHAALLLRNLIIAIEETE
jgi:hypothetical protein